MNAEDPQAGAGGDADGEEVGREVLAGKGRGSPADAGLDRFRAYLQVLAREHLHACLRGKLTPSDVVQQTLLRAWQALGQFRGTTDAELAAWLRRILARVLANAMRDMGVGKRDVRRERSLEQALEASSARLGALPAARQASPSEGAALNEQKLRLAQALEDLPAPQREALTLRYLHGWTVHAIAAHEGVTVAAVAGRLKRGLRQLHAQLRE
jgi:RNA polymerase sigma-70 factor (ECF subfamily)